MAIFLSVQGNKVDNIMFVHVCVGLSQMPMFTTQRNFGVFLLDGGTWMKETTLLTMGSCLEFMRLDPG